MTENLKKKLLMCERSSHRCLSAQLLQYILEAYVKELPYNEFISIYNFAINLNLPAEFKKELELEYKIRNTKPAM